MAGAVHLADPPGTALDTSWAAKAVPWLQGGAVVSLVALALCAPVSTKGAVNCFRAAVVLWMAALCTRRIKLRPQPVTAPLLLFFIFTGLSSAFSIDPFLSWGRMRTVGLIFLVVLTGQVLQSLRQVKVVAGALLLSCLVAVMYTGWQYTAGIGVHAVASGPAAVLLQRAGIRQGDIIRELGGTRIRSPQQLLGPQIPKGRVQLVLWRETPNALQPFRVTVNARVLESALTAPGVILARAHPPRAQGFFKHYFPFSEVLVFMGMLALGLCLTAAARRSRLLLLAAFLGISLTLIWTLTRISVLSFVVGAMLIVLLRGSRRVRWISMVALVALATAGMWWVQKQRGMGATDPGTQYRLLMWRDSTKFIAARPLLGVGLDSIAGDWQRWNLAAYQRFGLHSHFHSTPIQLAVECGLPALIVWVWFLAATAGFFFRSQRRLHPQSNFPEGVVLGAMGSLAGFIVTGFVQYNFGDAEAVIVLWLILGLAFACVRLGYERSERFTPQDAPGK